MSDKLAKHVRCVTVIVAILVSARAWAGTVNYQVTFDATWSAATHPQAIPAGAHFSPSIGTTHNDQVTFWQDGGTATRGIELMAARPLWVPLRSRSCLNQAVLLSRVLEHSHYFCPVVGDNAHWSWLSR